MGRDAGPSQVATPADGAAGRLRSVIVFARVPRLGMVKTRLAAGIGDAGALRVYRELLERALELAAGASPGTAELCVAGEDADGECAALAARFGMRLSAQHGADLGARMQRALSSALGAGRTPVLIGSDCPVLDASDLEAAFDALHSNDAVFAPTEDGGYALVGVSRPIPRVFDGPEWGTTSVMATTRRLLRRDAVRWHELRTVWDLDDQAGYLRWRASSGDD